MEIIQNVHRVPGLSGANVYLLIGRELTLIDAGMPGQTDAILSYIEGLGRAAGDLARIVVTHDHLDHVGSLASLRQETSAQVIAHKAEAPLISGEQPHPPPRSLLMRLLALLAPIMPRADPAPVDLTAEDGDQLDLLGGATVVHVPGHTPGSIALHLPDEGLLFCGDAIDYRGKQPGPPIKAFTQDMGLAMDSSRRMADLDFDVLCPGHGAAIAGGADKQIRAMVQDWA